MAGLDDISVSNFTVVEYTTDGGTNWLPITNVNAIGDLSDEKNIIDVQEYGATYLRKLVGTANAGPMDITVNFKPDDTSHIYLLASYKAGRQEQMRLVMYNADQSAGDFVEFNGFVASKSQGNAFDSARTMVFSIAVDGALGDVTPLP